MRHADAGYDLAIDTANERGVDLPMINGWKMTAATRAAVEKEARRILAARYAGRSSCQDDAIGWAALALSGRD